MRSFVRCANGGTTKPSRFNSSARTTAGPPGVADDGDAAAIQLAPGAGEHDGDVDQFGARLHPVLCRLCRTSACTAVSLVVIAPVWLAAARLPASVAPDLMPAREQPLRLRLRAWWRNAPGCFNHFDVEQLDVGAVRHPAPRHRVGAGRSLPSAPSCRH